MPLRVLVVDDSAYMRKSLREMLSRSAGIEVVGAARSGRDALAMVEALEPDVVTCDLVMPEMGGLEFVRAQLARRPLPIILISVVDGQASEVLQALEAGAVDFVQKPTARATDRVLDMAEELIAKVQAAGGVPQDRLRRPLPDSGAGLTAPPRPTRRRVGVVVIGISTGGPQALRQVLPLLPADCPAPIVVVIHMPVGYTELYAQKLDEVCDVKVLEARQGMVLEPGTVWIAPAGRHLRLLGDPNGPVRAELSLEPRDSPHRPSVDVLFISAAGVFGARTLGVVMTGMGSDGREGAAWIKARGGTVLTESEATCVVYGMPRSVMESGLSDASVPLERMALAIMERL
jgi:two-component system, chemotaxis family, protein-glutamate methylesterase/glutaminase